MPEMLTVYDRGGPATKDETTGITRPAVAAGELKMWAIDAAEAVRNDPTRYSLKPWKDLKVSPKDAAKAATAKKADDDARKAAEKAAADAGGVVQPEHPFPSKTFP